MASKLIGVSRYGGKWVATLSVNDTSHEVGVFSTPEQAALAHDMEALRAYGTKATNLNFTYEVVEINNHENGNRMKLRNYSGLEIVVDVVNEDMPYKPVYVCPSARSKTLTPHISSSILSMGTPTLPDATRNWYTRTNSIYTPSASFSYEITFPHKNSLGLNLRPHSIYYSALSDRYIGVLLVVESLSLLSSIVCPGDIILKVNNNNLTDFGSKFNFDHMTNLITSAAPPRTVTFLRPSGPSHTLSPVEVCLFLGTTPDACLAEPPQIIIPPRPPPSSARFNVLINPGGATQSLQLVYLNPNAPLAIKRTMQGMKVNWEGNPASVSSNSSSALKSLSLSSQATKMTSTTENLNSRKASAQEVFQETESTASLTDPSGAVRKWVVQLVIPPRSENENFVQIKINPESEESHSNDLSTLTKQKTNLHSSRVEIINDVGAIGKRKRAVSGRGGGKSFADQSYRKKMALDKKYEKTYFLGKFDYEEDARAVLEIAKKEVLQNGGDFYPHRIIPPFRVIPPPPPNPAPHHPAPHHLTTSISSTSNIAYVGTAATQSSSLKQSSVTQPSSLKQSSVTQPSSLKQVSVTQPPSLKQVSVTQPPSLKQVSVTQPPSLKQSSVTQPSSLKQSVTYPSSSIAPPAPPKAKPKAKKIYLATSVKHLSAIKAVTACFKNNGPHSKKSFNFGFSTYQHCIPKLLSSPGTDDI